MALRVYIPYLENTVSVVPVDDSALQRDDICPFFKFVHIGGCASDGRGGKDQELKKLELYF